MKYMWLNIKFQIFGYVVKLQKILLGSDFIWQFTYTLKFVNVILPSVHSQQYQISISIVQ